MKIDEKSIKEEKIIMVSHLFAAGIDILLNMGYKKEDIKEKLIESIDINIK